MTDWNYLFSFAISSILTVFVIILALVLFLTFMNHVVARINRKLRSPKK